ncbi:hypothetical protein BDA96_10G331100 [Sorghum bicolor]|uniref:Uncharacterized protein n=2 Tax=Sorghum bicolor TaxID=4558 RepID=A0A921Q8X8_SORBI|nr:hypothetical protein BDA96_10G331100 [Sorghum bicolor]OQU77039.1 hypothetical protein SORBI_3010G256466 [Sorghum bicolor]
MAMIFSACNHVSTAPGAHRGWQRKLDPYYNVMKTLQILCLENWAKSLQYMIQEFMAP